MIVPIAHDPSMDQSSSDVEGGGSSNRNSRRTIASSSGSTIQARSRKPAVTSAAPGTDAPIADPLPGAMLQATAPTVPVQPSPTPQPNPTRHEEFWFHDGSIILHVESKLFRVHQTILANHSEVFAGLFDIPQPPPASGGVGGDVDGMVMEGCHIVMLHDGEKDFEDLLRAVYNPAHFDHLSPNADVDTLLTFVSGILRLSTKYMLRTLRQRCIALLTSKFPSTFNEYCLKSTPPSPQHPHHHHSTTRTHASPSTATAPAAKTKVERYRSDSIMRAIALATETNVFTILPYLYYCTARLPLRRILKSRPSDISFYQKTVALVGRERLRYAELSLSYSFLIVFRRAPECKELVKCGYSKGPEREWRLVEAESVKGPNPLRAYARWDELGVCRECVEWSGKAHLEGRKEVWDRLPEMFELPKWDTLKELQNR